jgi:ketosteroid isomerase-like protein
MQYFSSIPESKSMPNINILNTLRKMTGVGGIATFALLSALSASAQSPTPFDPFSHPNVQSSPLSQPTLSAGALLLLELEGRFAQAVAAGGGKAFASWFADDAVTLSNGLAPVLGHSSIASHADWDPKVYQLTWVPQGAQMGPSNDMGFTWGHYEGRSKDKNGQPVITSGRYFTVWKKLPDGNWKVAMDASANEPPDAGECCTLPKP